jgi:hypothetical protein
MRERVSESFCCHDAVSALSCAVAVVGAGIYFASRKVRGALDGEEEEGARELTDFLAAARTGGMTEASGR